MADVVVYSTDTCVFCTKVKDYLKSKNIDYTEKNLSKDAEAKKEFMKMGHMGVPVLLINGEEVIGFDQPKIDQLLNL
ncbi:MAG: glutaredoxin family protein [Tissierellia bacterium]|nr:glutaredoxin family protein [Tissierellia bacterium]